MTTDIEAPADLTQLTSHIVSAYVANNALSPADVPRMVADVLAALRGLGAAPEVPSRREPAVPVRRSVQPDAITCLECGKKFKSLKRHLMTSHKLTPGQYRENWSLPRNYPMVARAYSEVRTELAKAAGLGRKTAAKKVAAKKAPRRKRKS